MNSLPARALDFVACGAQPVDQLHHLVGADDDHGIVVTKGVLLNEVNHPVDRFNHNFL